MNGSRAKLRIFILHASHNLTNHDANGDGLVAWLYIAELARRGHRIHAVTDKLDVLGDVPPNLTLVELPRRSRNQFVHYFSYMWRVRKLYNQIAATQGIDVAHQMNPVVRGLSLALLGRQVPLVLGTYVGDWKPRADVRVPFKQRISNALKASLDALQQWPATRLALATPYALSRVPFFFAKMEQIRFLHHGVDTTLFTPEPRPGDPAVRPASVLFLGSIDYYKGVATLIDAFVSIAGEIPHAKLVFVGAGLIEEMRRRLAAHGLENRAEFLGPLPRADVAGWLRACSVLCAPSFGEPYGQNILEAMATGKPVVATTEGGQRYLLDASGGYYITPGDGCALADALKAILGDVDTAARMGRHNRQVVEARNTPLLVANELEHIYRGAIAMKRKRSNRVSPAAGKEHATIQESLAR